MEYCPNSKNLGIGLLASGFLFSVYSEMSIGNVWYRQDESGNRKFSFSNLGNFFVRPFHKTDMWTRETLANNSILFTTFTAYPISLVIQNSDKISNFLLKPANSIV